MSTPKHRTLSGSSYFVTTRSWQGRSVFQVPENAEILIECIIRYRDQGSYLLHEFVVMPNHLHVLFTPSETTSLEKAVQLIKGGSSHAIHKQRGHKIEIWQEGFHDWTVRDADDWEAKVTYIRMNPVRARLVANAEDWAWSSASGKYALDKVPARYERLASGAKAPFVVGTVTRGLKPPPPEHVANATVTRGLKSPPPEDLGNVAAAPGLKSRPPVCVERLAHHKGPRG